MGLLSAVHLKWQPRGGGGGKSLLACPPCASVTSCHTALCTHVPGGGQEGAQEHSQGAFPALFHLKWLKLLSSCRWIWAPWGCPAVNHCVKAMQAALMWSVLGVSSNRTGGEWTGQRGFFPQMHCSGCHPWGEMPHLPVDCCLFLVLAAPCLLLCYAKQRPQALQSAS